MFDDVITTTGISGGHHPEFPEDPGVELRGIEPLTSTVRLLRSTN